MYTILIIDDEQIIRQGLVNLLSKIGGVYQVVGEAQDGKVALEKAIDLLPDIILCDINMPHMNGFEFIQNIHDYLPNSKFIIISGYDDFEFVQQALKLNVSDYLLKPIKKEALLDTLEKVSCEIEQSKRIRYDVEKLKATVKKSLPAARERFFNLLVAGKIQNAEIDEQKKYLELDLTGNLFTIAFLKIRYPQPADTNEMQAEDMLMGFLKTEGNLFFQGSVHTVPFYYNMNEICIFINSYHENSGEFFTALNDGFNEFVKFIKRNMGILLTVSIGRIYSNVSDISGCVKEAETALQYRILGNETAVINYEDLHLYQNEHFDRPLLLEEELLIEIKLCHPKEAKTKIEEIFDYYTEQSEMTIMTMKTFLFETEIMIVRAIDDIVGCANSEYHLLTNPYESLSHSDTLKDLKIQISEMVEAGIECLQVSRNSKSTSIVNETKNMILIYKHDPELSTEFLSKKLFISPNYLRQLFKQQVGKTFVEYVTQIRMEESIKLLEDFTLKIQDIAEKVGYNDSRYFSYCFKKYYQITPTEYRELKKSESVF